MSSIVREKVARKLPERINPEISIPDLRAFDYMDSIRLIMRCIS